MGLLGNRNNPTLVGAIRVRCVKLNFVLGLVLVALCRHLGCCAVYVCHHALNFVSIFFLSWKICNTDVFIPCYMFVTVWVPFLLWSMQTCATRLLATLQQPCSWWTLKSCWLYWMQFSGLMMMKSADARSLALPLNAFLVSWYETNHLKVQFLGSTTECSIFFCLIWGYEQIIGQLRWQKRVELSRLGVYMWYLIGWMDNGLGGLGRMRSNKPT